MYVKPGPHNNQYWYLLKIPGRIAYKQFPLQIKKQAKEWYEGGTCINGDAADGKSGFRPEIQGGEGGENPNIG